MNFEDPINIDLVSESKLDEYYDLVDREIDGLTIQKDSHFNCLLKSIESDEVYKGFILAKIATGSSFTLCEIDFQKSGTDGKFQPRLIFRRTDSTLQDKKVKSNSYYQRISFQTGNDGYRQFWKMIAFLYKFKDLVDVGRFQEQYQVISENQFLGYLNDKSKFRNLSEAMQIADKVDIDAATILNTALIIDLLKKNKKKLEQFITDSANERDVQKWLDEDGYKYRFQRCLIFGLEFVRHKREGGASGNKYDLLTRIGAQNRERVLVELKSPSDTVFDVSSKVTVNNSKDEYVLSKSLSRAIPQILEYKWALEGKQAGDPELEKIDETDVLKIAKCIIVVGKDNDKNPRWINNLRALRSSLNSSLEIWTYTDLIHKLDATISNLELQITENNDF